MEQTWKSLARSKYLLRVRIDKLCILSAVYKIYYYIVSSASALGLYMSLSPTTTHAILSASAQDPMSDCSS